MPIRAQCREPVRVEGFGVATRIGTVASLYVNAKGNLELRAGADVAEIALLSRDESSVMNCLRQGVRYTGPVIAVSEGRFVAELSPK